MRAHPFLVIPSLLLAVACVEEPAPTLPIAALLSFTGPAPATGTAEERAMRLAAEQVNDAGGVAGVPLSIRADDTRGDLQEGLDAAKPMFESSDALAVVGAANEDLVKRVVPLSTS